MLSSFTSLSVLFSWTMTYSNSKENNLQLNKSKKSKKIHLDLITLTFFDNGVGLPSLAKCFLGSLYPRSLYPLLQVKANGSLICDLNLFHHRPYECLLLGYTGGEVSFSWPFQIDFK